MGLKKQADRVRLLHLGQRGLALREMETRQALMFVGPRAQVKLKIILYWAGQDFLRAVFQSETFPTQTSFLSCLLSSVLDLLCGLKAFPAHSSLSSLYLSQASPQTNLLLFWLCLGICFLENSNWHNIIHLVNSAKHWYCILLMLHLGLHTNKF